ncbi:MAG: hypothetical protein NVS3B15_11610 [Sediminibacterium sp.]
MIGKAMLFLLFAFSWQFSPLQAQTPATYNSADIYMQLKKLNVLGSVLYIAAHPDDENNGFLPYLAKEKLYRTGYLSLTRGDGGQNLIGSEQGIELGLIRSQELLAARRMDGAEQYFSRAYEFGFSKSAGEALRIWDRNKVLSDVVWMIRQFQPDIIITRFPGDARAGHGHHAASSILANEAFAAAADPNQFQEQLKYGVKAWQAKRILWNTYNFGSTNTTAPDQLKVDVGGYNPLLGKSYGEIGAEARSMHKSQGEGRPRRRGTSFEFFKTTGGEAPVNDLMDGVITSWNRVEGGAAIQSAIDHIISEYRFESPESSVDSLVTLYKQIQRLPDHGVWWTKKLNEVQELILSCSGVFADATSDNEYAVLGEQVNINFFLNKRSRSAIRLERIELKPTNDYSFDSLFNAELPVNQNISFTKTFTVPVKKRLTQPYWLIKPLDGIGMFQVTDQYLIGNAEDTPPYVANFVFRINGVRLFVSKPVQYKYTDPVKGEEYQPLVVITPLVVSLSPDVALTNVKRNNVVAVKPELDLQYKSNFAAAKVPVTIHLKQGDTVIFARDTVIDFETGKVYNLSLPVKNNFNINLDPFISAEIILTVNNAKQVYTHYLRAIKYDHIPDIHYFYKDQLHVLPDEVKVTGKKVGYINGAGDKVPEALVQLGYEVKLLSEQDLTDGNLDQFDAIITGIRSYNIHEYLTTRNDVLNRYVQHGGNLIVQYLKSNQVGSSRTKVGPYPFAVNAGSRVTEENATVHLLLPEHPVLNYPNKITEKDFENWVQERSTYQAEQADAHYEMPLGMHDTGEKESSGSLLTTKYGKGNFAYVSLVLFRELPAGIPGAYRLLANLIALPKNK